MAFGETLNLLLSTAGIAVAPSIRAAIEAHVRLLMSWNTAMNLTAIRSPGAVALEHVADSLSALPLLHKLGRADRALPSMLDLGSGAGFPGLPLGLALPVGRLALLDSVRKKARFLGVAATAAVEAARRAGEADPPLVEVHAQRAEELVRSPGERAGWDIVTARAVAPLAELVELALPFLCVGGRLVAWKRDAGDGGLDREIAEAAPRLLACGARLEGVEEVRIEGLKDHRLVVVQAVSTVPDRYPRPAAERRRDRGA